MRKCTLKKGENMLEAKDISKTFIIKDKKFFSRKPKSKIEAVKEVSMQIRTGEIKSFVGVNGAGKTTLIRILSTQLKPDMGEVTIDGKNIYKGDCRSVKQIINVVNGGERNLYWRLSAVENLRYFGSLYYMDKFELSKRIEKYLNIVDLYKYKDIPVEKFSKGMKQRLQIARGLLNNPKYLFLDEPTLGLDLKGAKEIRKLIKNLAKEEDKGIVLTSHYLEDIEILSDYIYLLDNGMIIREGTIADIKTMNGMALYKFFLGNIQDVKFSELENISNCKVKSTNFQENTFIIEVENKELNTVIKVLIDRGVVINGIEIEDNYLENFILGEGIRSE